METRQKIQTYYTNSGLALAIRLQSGDKKCEVVCQFGESNPDKKFSFLLKIFYWIRKEVKRIRSRIQKSYFCCLFPLNQVDEARWSGRCPLLEPWFATLPCMFHVTTNTSIFGPPKAACDLHTVCYHAKQ